MPGEPFHDVNIGCIRSEYEIVPLWFQRFYIISAGINARPLAAITERPDTIWPVCYKPAATCTPTTTTKRQLADSFGKTYGVTKNGSDGRKNSGNLGLEFGTSLTTPRYGLCGSLQASSIRRLPAQGRGLSASGVLSAGQRHQEV